MEFWIRNKNLASQGKKEVEQALRDMPGIQELRRRYMDAKPLKGLNITGCVWVTYETANLILLLRDMGANIRWCSDNKYASLDDACAYLVSENVSIFAKKGMTDKEHIDCFDKAWRFKNIKGEIIGPDYIIDDGCDITRYLNTEHPDVLLGVKGLTEQTTCGITALKKLAEDKELKCPAINVNDSVTKSKFDNIYGARESLLEGFQNILNMQIAGKKCVIFGYGEVGKGCSQVMRGLGAHVSICEVDPINAMQAHMEGLDVLDKETAVKVGDIFITATGCIKVLDQDDIENLKDGAVLMNMGHGDMEINMHFLNSSVYKKEEINPLLTKYTKNSKSVFVLYDGYLVNTAGNAGHPPRVMSITFTNHIVALLEMVKTPEKYNKNVIYKLNTKLEEEVAKINFPEVAKKLIKLTDEQAEYLNVNKEGPFKDTDYRY